MIRVNLYAQMLKLKDKLISHLEKNKSNIYNSLINQTLRSLLSKIKISIKIVYNQIIINNFKIIRVFNKKIRYMVQVNKS